MRRIVSAMAACLALACAALFWACAAESPGDAPQAGESFAGVWTMAEAADGDDAVDAEDLAVLDALDMTVQLALNQDGSAVLTVFDDATEGTWEASGESEATALFQNQMAFMSIEGDMLTMEQNGASLTFRKQPEPVAGGQEGDDASGNADADADSSAEPSDGNPDAVSGEASASETPAEGQSSASQVTGSQESASASAAEAASAAAPSSTASA